MSLLRIALTLPLFAFLLPACGGGGSDYVGDWQLDPSAAIEAIRSEAEGDPMGEMMIQMAESMFESMEITMSIADDGSFTMSMTGSMAGQEMDDTSAGTWVESDTGITMTLEGQEDEAEATLEDGNLVLDFADESAPNFVMTRKS